MNPDLIGVILAGGKSERMGGGDKSLIPVGGKPIIAHIIDRLHPTVGRIAINANGDPSRYAGFGPPVIKDTVPGQPGPLAGILAAMECAHANSNLDVVATVAGDTPFFPKGLFERLMWWREDFPDRIILCATGDKVHAVFGLWPVRLRTDLAEHLAKDLVSGGDRSVLSWAGRHNFMKANYPVRNFMGRTIEPFININTPEDLQKAEDHFRTNES